VEASKRSMLLELREDVIEKLATQLSTRVKERAAMAGGVKESTYRGLKAPGLATGRTF
jgi:hypothetical protein